MMLFLILNIFIYVAASCVESTGEETSIDKLLPKTLSVYSLLLQKISGKTIGSSFHKSITAGQQGISIASL